MKESKRITVEKASRMMKCGPQQIRMLVRNGKIPGAFCTDVKSRRTYYIYEEQILNLTKGAAK